MSMPQLSTPGRAALWGVVLLVAGAATARWVDLSPQVESDFFFAEDDPQMRATVDIQRRYPGGEQIVVRVAGAVDTPAYLGRVEALTAGLSSLAGVTAAQSIANQSAARSPLWSRLLLVPGSGATNIILQIDGSVPAEALVPRLDSVIQSLDGTQDVVVSGVPVIVERIRLSLFRDLLVFSGAALVLFGVLIALVYRQAVLVLGTLLSALLACSLTLLLNRAAGLSIGLLTANIVTIVFVLTLSHVVFLTANWKRALARAPDQDAVAAAIRETREGSFWSMTTTLLGFLSLLLATAQPLRELGMAGAIGALTALAVTYAVYPTFLRAARAPGVAVNEGRLDVRRLLPRRYGLHWAGGLTLVGLLIGTGLFRLNTDPGLLTYFAQGSELRRGLEAIDRDGGSSTLDVLVRREDGERLDDREGYDRMWAFQDSLETHAAVGVTVSPAVLLGHARQQPLAGFLTIGMLADLLDGDIAGQVGRGFLSPDRLEARYLIRVREADRSAPRDSLVAQVQRDARTAGLTPVALGGVYALQGELGRLIAASLRIGLGGLLVLFFAVGVVVSGRASIGVALLASVICVPLVTLGAMGHLGIAVDMITSPAANVAMAMGVDAMIHITVRHRLLERAGTPDAWIQARDELAGPVVAAALIISVGFGIFSLSTFPPTARFGFAVIVGTLTAALMALVVLPAFAGRLATRLANEPLAQAELPEHETRA